MASSIEKKKQIQSETKQDLSEGTLRLLKKKKIVRTMLFWLAKRGRHKLLQKDTSRAFFYIIKLNCLDIH